MSQAGGVNIVFGIEWHPQLIGQVFEELALAIQALGLVGVEGSQKLLVGKEGHVEHGAEEHRSQAQRIEKFDAETAGCGVEDAQHRRQHHENESGEKEADTGPAEVMRNGHEV